MKCVMTPRTGLELGRLRSRLGRHMQQTSRSRGLTSQSRLGLGSLRLEPIPDFDGTNITTEIV